MLWLLVVCVAVAAAAERPKTTPQRCCTPNTWTARLGSSVGAVRNHVPTREYRDTMAYYDFTGQKSAFDEFTFYGDETVRSRRFINLHRERRGFMIEENECFRFELREMQKACIPEDAQYVSNATWGYGAGANMTVNNWVAPIKDGDRTIGGHGFTYTSTGCFPVAVGTAVRFFDERERQFIAELEGLGFHDIAGTITNPEAFIPPSTCERATPIGPHDSRLDHFKLLQKMVFGY